MKQKFILSFMAIAFGVLSLSAQSGEKLVVNAGGAEHIRIAQDMDIVLIPGTDAAVSLDARAAEVLNLKLSNNSLVIEAPGNPKERPTVYLYVGNLKKLTVENNCTVRTIGFLNSPKLNVYIDGEATVHLVTNGSVNAYSLSDSEINIKYKSDYAVTKG